MLSKQKKQRLIKKYQTHAGDTGSTAVQIAILTAEIEELIEHLKVHHKDHSSRRGLLRKVGERRKLLRYLQKEDPETYEKIMADLKLKKSKVKLVEEKDPLDEEKEDKDSEEKKENKNE